MKKNKYSGFQKLDHKISKIIKPISKKKKDNFVILNNLSKNWETIVGAKYYRYCYPKKVQFNTNKKTVLFIGSYNNISLLAAQKMRSTLWRAPMTAIGAKKTITTTAMFARRLSLLL